jgi:non-specific serine/threonine protein kinase
MAIARELDDDAIVSRFLSAEGYLAFMSDDLVRARSLLEESLAVAERMGDRMAIAVGHHTVGQVARLDGRLEEAAAHYRDALRFGQELGDAASMSEPLQGLAAVAVATGDAERGVRLLGANDAIREQLGGGPPPEWLRLGDPLEDARRSLGDAAYQQAWQAGRALSVDEAVALALRETAGQ